MHHCRNIKTKQGKKVSSHVKLKLNNISVLYFKSTKKLESHYRQRLKTCPGPGPGPQKIRTPLEMDPFEKPDPKDEKHCHLCDMKDNVEVIHFHIIRRGVQGVVFMKKMYKKCTTDFCFENGNVDAKTLIANFYLQY